MIIDYYKKRPAHIPEEEIRYYNLLRIVHPLALSIHVVFIFLFLWLEIPELYLIQPISIAIFGFGIYLNQRRKYLLSVIIGSYEVILHQIYASHFLGLDSHIHAYLALSAMVPYLVEKDKEFQKGIVVFSSVSAYIFVELYIGSIEPVYTLSSTFLNIFGAFNIFVTGIFLGIFGLYFSQAINESERKLKLERQKSDDLLHNILPLSIANRLKETDGIIADGFDSVSVLFADIAGFTKLSETMSPKELVIKLNKIFSDFDALVEKYELEKIKTIGDAYMVSAGIPEHDSEHAQKIALFALEMKNYMEKRAKSEANPLQIRIGIHAGPAVAGVIGIKKFAYDLWGDTVNTASRMESHGETGKIHVSEAFQLLIQDQFSFEKRDIIDVKGKGKMQTYFLLDKKEAEKVAK